MRAVATAKASAFDPLVAETALRGLAAPRKTLPPHLLYDPEGCRLFEAITTLPEYYVTRTELALLRQVGPELHARIGRGASVVEYGAGSATKAALLLSALEAPAAYVPLDIAEGAVKASAREIRARFPAVAVHPQVCDFNRRIALPPLPAPLLGFFPGSTIGNLDTEAALAFLGAVRASLGQGARFLVGVDLPKSPAVLIPAYDDAAGVTAAFNLNLLHRLNREAAADFDWRGSHTRRCGTWRRAASRCICAATPRNPSRWPARRSISAPARASTPRTATSAHRRPSRPWRARRVGGPRQCGRTRRACSPCTSWRPEPQEGRPADGEALPSPCILLSGSGGRSGSAAAAPSARTRR
ncbi:L-histidine N(alpha)-methyltransferase [Teichococcus aestuarii]